MVETLDLWSWSSDKPNITVTVEYVPVPHWNADSGMKAYDVTAGGVTIGTVEQSIESTDRHYGRIRSVGRGRIAWSWQRPDGKRNSAGLYAATRRDAVAEILGYSSARKVSA